MCSFGADDREIHGAGCVAGRDGWSGLARLHTHGGGLRQIQMQLSTRFESVEAGTRVIGFTCWVGAVALGSCGRGWDLEVARIYAERSELLLQCRIESGSMTDGSYVGEMSSGGWKARRFRLHWWLGCALITVADRWFHSHWCWRWQ